MNNSNPHKENLQKWYDFYAEAIRDFGPALHPQIVVEWGVCDKGREKDHMYIRMNRDINLQSTENIIPQRVRRNLRRFREYKKKLEEIREMRNPPIPIEGEEKGIYAKYNVPLSDLSQDLQEERKQLLDRNTKIHQIEMMVIDAQNSLKGAYPWTFGMGDKTAQCVISNLTKKLNFLEDAQEIANKVKPESFRKDLFQHQNRILTYLGLPTSVPERPKGGPLENNNPGIYVSRSWFWPHYQRYYSFDLERLKD